MHRISHIVLGVVLLAPGLGWSDEQPWREIQGDVVYGHKLGLAMTYDVIKPTDKANGAGVIFMMSGGWVSTWVPPENLVRENPDTKNLWESIVDRGYTLFIVRHGSSPLFKVPDATADVRRAMRHISANAEAYGIDAKRIGVCGGSAGGHLSLMLGTDGDDGQPGASDSVEAAACRAACVVAYFPPTDLNAYVGPDKPIVEQFPALDFDVEKADAVSPLLQVSKDDAPTLLVHGDQDKLVPIWHSEKLKAEMDRVGVQCDLITIKGAAHGFLGKDNERAQTALLEWFDRYLQQEK